MTDDSLTPFLFEGEIIVRVIRINGIPWFVAADVGRALGLKNAAESVRGLDDDEKDVSSADTPGGRQEVIIISLSGIFALVLRSRKPEARRFCKWITAEVLPSIQATGAYIQPSAIIIRKPYAEWSLEQRRTALAEVDTARKSLSRGAAAWMWEYLGFPIPPRHLLPSWWQGELLG
jgi:prophage antirepressor-like protein